MLRCAALRCVHGLAMATATESSCGRVACAQQSNRPVPRAGPSCTYLHGSVGPPLLFCSLALRQQPCKFALAPASPQSATFGLGHNCGLKPERIPIAMAAYAQQRANTHPACFGVGVARRASGCGVAMRMCHHMAASLADRCPPPPSPPRTYATARHPGRPRHPRRRPSRAA